MYLTKGAPLMATIVPTAIVVGNPTQVTAPAPTGPVLAYAVGQVVVCRDTGFPELDDKFFTIASVTAGGFALLGADTTGSTGVLSAAPEMDVYDAADMLKMCLNNMAFNLTTPSTIAAGTYCNPSATLPGTPTTVGTMTLGGWIDVDDEAYAELLKANDDGLQRVLTIMLPQQQGEIVAPLALSSGTWALPLDGGMGFTATADLAAEPRHLF